MYTALFIIAAYLLGSISFALVTSKLFGLDDPRTYGSGNPGATNVLRSGNKLAALLTLIGDAAKGWLAVFLASWLADKVGIGIWGVAGVAIAAFIGHLFPVFSGFKGGKGVATGLGVLLGINPMLGGFVLLTWLLVAFLTRYSSLSALVSAALAPVYYGLMFRVDAFFYAICIISALLIFRHRQNIINLVSGTESKIGSKKKAV
ncbi:MAG: glycerol-3-phosphate 1-O-acyltransferase PlsY [Oxalobacter sp.]|nr:glycerol-3-phosphate 1-O-acyltransferase PlsY [Oxalobacter sp.]